MQKSKIHGKLVSFVPIRRGNWIVKTSVYKDKFVMFIAYNTSTAEFVVKQFNNQIDAVKWLEMIIEKDARLHSSPEE